MLIGTKPLSPPDCDKTSQKQDIAEEEDQMAGKKDGCKSSEPQRLYRLSKRKSISERIQNLSHSFQGVKFQTIKQPQVNDLEASMNIDASLADYSFARQSLKQPKMQTLQSQPKLHYDYNRVARIQRRASLIPSGMKLPLLPPNVVNSSKPLAFQNLTTNTIVSSHPHRQ